MLNDLNSMISYRLMFNVCAVVEPATRVMSKNEDATGFELVSTILKSEMPQVRD